MIPYIDWASLDVSEWCVKDDAIIAIIEEILDTKVASITTIQEDITIANWKVDLMPVKVAKG